MTTNSNPHTKEQAPAFGMHERHLRRKDGNPLYGVPAPRYGIADYLQARRLDSEELNDFQGEMQTVIQQAINLPPNAESEVVLELRGKLDQLYTRCSGFDASCGSHKQAIRKLIEVVMTAVWQASAGDPMARMELEQEEVARQQHYCLLEYPLISDLMRPDTPITQAELIPTLLQAEEDELEAVLWLFEPEQLDDISAQASELLSRLQGEGHDLPEAWENLQAIIEHIETEL
ncbi:MAG: hypothetical protein OQK94_01570 [Gammaproteobacteria bacterium]|nr:hypothetical protein [Gammaproteobacteria bacterium]